MRDQEIYNVIEKKMLLLADMVSSDVHNLQRGISMLRCRQDATERLLFGSRWGIVKAVILQLISPRLLTKTLNHIHQEEIEKYNVNRRMAQSANKIKGAPQPGMILTH